ncbi:trypsin-like serine peptidase [Streptomyces gamaensis]|uniref:Trypsin-like serine peptidase n=1 Tax=Streptomyces gamaensis TaxID=1763542 RepID=A0ABW0YUJ6_9ACTN
MRFTTSRLPRLAAAIGALAIGIGTAGTVGSAQAATPGPMDAATASTAATQSSTDHGEQARSHWTAERMRTAGPIPVPAERHTVQAQSHRLAAQSSAGTAAPAAVASRAQATAGLSGATAVSRSGVWNAHGRMPATTVGKLYFSTPRGNSECTATVVNSPNKSVVWTAGHCVSDGKGHWYKNWVFVPDYHDGVRPLGAWSWKTVSTPNGYFKKGDSNYDLAALTLWPQNGRKVADVTGSQGYKFNYGYTWNAYEFGYPYDTHPARPGINGQQLRYCIGKTWRAGGQQAIHCDQGHGSSGGPWLDDLQLGRGWGYLVGNVSHHLSERSDEERSPHFGDAAVNVYNQVKNA